jgi:hypothetical protein
MKFLKDVWDIVQGAYYLILTIFGFIGFEQVFTCTEAKDTNIIVTIVSLFAMEYGIKNFIKIMMRIWND